MPRKKFRTARRKNKADITPNNQLSRKRKLWTDVQMTSALEEYKKGKMTIGKIAKKFNVPKTTLHDRISGRVYNMELSMDQIQIHIYEEEALVEHLISAAKQGYGKTRKQVNMTVEMVAKSKGVLRKDKFQMAGGEDLLSVNQKFLFDVQTLLHTSVWIQ